jgi:Xaa-Pro aminopeptidase
VPAAETFRWIRLIKTEEEIQRLGAVASIAEELERLAFAAARPGCDWAGVVGRMPAEAARRGATFEFWSGGAGSHGGFLFPGVDQALEQGDLIRLDLTVTWRGYASDTGRSASIGEPSQLATDRYAAIRSAVEAAIDEVRPGRTFAQVYAAAMKAGNRLMPELQRHHCGHSIGVLAYDGPLVARGHDVLLEPGMTLNIEVPYYELGWGGLQLEETVVVTEHGHALLTNLPRDLAVLPDAA